MSMSTLKPVRVKKEDDVDSEVGHPHTFKVKFSDNDQVEYTTECQSPGTVLEAIKSNVQYRKKQGDVSDENVVIQRGRGDMECTIATHFPCVLIKHECLKVMREKETVEKIRDQNGFIEIEQEEQYSVFYIDVKGGKNAKTKKLFKSSALTNFKYVCVYGTKGMSVKEALERDGRFSDDIITDFYLSHNDKPTEETHCLVTVDSLHQQKFTLRLPRNLKRRCDYNQQERPGATNKARHSQETQQGYDKIKEAAAYRGVSVMKNSGAGNHEELYEILCQQFPQLRKRMLDRFPGESYDELLQIKKENFGKIQQSFSEVYRVRELLELGKSVCKIIVGEFGVGTGFVLFDNYILTNAHLFRKNEETEDVMELADVKVSALFGYDNPEPHTDYCRFMCKKTDYIDIDVQMDYAVLELDPEGKRPNPQTVKECRNVPPGLLKKFGPVPESGEACIIGHPGGEIKKLDPTCIIEKKERIREINEHFSDHHNSLFTIHSIKQALQNQGIENIVCGGSRTDKVITYNTFMLHGSSGSPVFGCDRRVFGLHSAGFTYGFPKHEKSVIEVAYPLLHIFNQFARNMKNNNSGLYDRIKTKAKGNKYLQRELEIEPMDTS